MFYVILDIFLKVSLNTIKTGHHFIPDILLKVMLNTNKTVRYVITDIVESGVKH